MIGSRFIMIVVVVLCALALLVVSSILLAERADANTTRDYVKCAKRATKRLNEHRACFGMKAVHPTITEENAHAVWKDACARCKRLRYRMTHPGGSGVERWRPLVRHCFGRQGIGWRTNEALSVITRESGGDHRCLNASGAAGLFQFMPCWYASTAQAFDPWWNVNRAARAVKAQGGWYPAWAATAP